MVPLWNVEEIQVESQTFRHPCMEEVIYEHIYALGIKGDEEARILVETKEGDLPEYLQESWLRYLLFQLQLEFLEYQCRGKWE